MRGAFECLIGYHKYYTLYLSFNLGIEPKTSALN